MHIDFPRYGFALMLITSIVGCAGAPEPTARLEVDLSCATDKLDLLVVVDPTPSMLDSREVIEGKLPELIRALTTGDADGDGQADFDPITDVHIGVITTGMTIQTSFDPTCHETENGLMPTDSTVGPPRCGATYPRYFVHRGDDGGEVEDLAHDVACVAERGYERCGFEQPLEAMLKALTSSTSPIAFHGGAMGLGDGPHAGFLREDSILAVLVLTDEDDGSTPDPEGVYGVDAAGSPSLRVAIHADRMHPIERYVDGLFALRPHPERLMFGVLAGVPPELLRTADRSCASASDCEVGTFCSTHGVCAYDVPALLADPRLEYREDPELPGYLAASCRMPVDGVEATAFPPRRLLSMAERVQKRGGQALLHSICSNDLDPMVDGFVERVVRILSARSCEP